MSSLLLESSSLAHWHMLVGEAQCSCGTRVDVSAEAYLVGLLDHCCRRPDLFRRPVALDYLEAQGASSPAEQQTRLRAIGDQCLLCSGLFPKLARRRLVRIGYFVRLGRSAYHQLFSLAGDDLYRGLSEAFVPLMELLHAIRGLDGSEVLSPIEAAELWADTGSSRALRSLGASSAGRLLPYPCRRH